MNLEEVKRTIVLIDSIQDDYEEAHSIEDELYEAVLKEVVEGNVEAEEMAREALKTKKIDFPRYCA